MKSSSKKNIGNGVVRPDYDLDSARAKKIRDEFMSIVEKDFPEVSIDLGSVKSIAPSCLAVLVSTHKSLAKKQGRLKVVNASDPLLKMLKVMRLDEHFEVV